MASPLDREAIMVALFALLDAGYPWGTSGRILLPFTSVNSFPAMFVQHIGDEYLTASSINQHRPTGIPPMIYVDADVWIYTEGTPNVTVLETELNRLTDIVEGILQPRPARSAQTLGGLVRHCWIDGKTVLVQGNLAGQGKAMIPLRMLVPGTSPPGVATP